MTSRFLKPSLLVLTAISALWIYSHAEDKEDKKETTKEAMTDKDKKTAVATLGGGCFWCVEKPLEMIDGVIDVRSGYMGGKSENPTYEEVCSKTRNTGHIEVVEIEYDPAKISFDLVLEAFWIIHDPTSKDRQGYDVGIQYRSVIFYHDEAQKKASEASIKKQNDSGKWDKKLVTEVRAAEKFWPAEDYHQDYFDKNPSNRYCNAKIPPKIFKLFQDANFKDRRQEEKK